MSKNKVGGDCMNLIVSLIPVILILVVLLGTIILFIKSIVDRKKLKDSK